MTIQPTTAPGLTLPRVATTPAPPARSASESAEGGALAPPGCSCGTCPPSGLVICRKTVRETSDEIKDLVIPDNAAEIFEGKGYRFPSRDDLAAALDWGAWDWDGREGAVPQLHLAPGVVRLTAPDLNRREKTANKNAEKAAARDALALADDEGDGNGGIITGWSRESRARMIRTLAELDYSPIMGTHERPAMITLTYPGDWLAVAPDGKTVKKHLTSLFKRFARAWGRDWAGVWKLEFQARGAPHFHLLMSVPLGTAQAGKGKRAAVGDGERFARWLSLVWADIVGAAGEEGERHKLAGTGVDFAEGERARDPRRCAVYFSKHGIFGDKEYQHSVPAQWLETGESVGRFWGYRGLEKIIEGVVLTPDESIKAGRVLRHIGTRSTRWNQAKRERETVKAMKRETRPRWKRDENGEKLPRFATDRFGARLLDADGNPIPLLDADGEPAPRYRRTLTPVKRMRGKFGAGYLCVENAPQIARDLGRYLAQQKEPPAPRVGLRGSVAERGLFRADERD